MVWGDSGERKVPDYRVSAIHVAVVFEALNQGLPALPERSRRGAPSANDALAAVATDCDASGLRGGGDRSLGIENVLYRLLDVALANGPDGNGSGRGHPEVRQGPS